MWAPPLDHVFGIHLTASMQSKMAKREPLRVLLLWWLPLLCEYPFCRGVRGLGGAGEG